MCTAAIHRCRDPVPRNDPQVQRNDPQVHPSNATSWILLPGHVTIDPPYQSGFAGLPTKRSIPPTNQDKRSCPHNDRFHFQSVNLIDRSTLVYIYIYTLYVVYIYTYIYIYRYVCICMHIHIYIYIYTHICKYVYIYIDIYIYIYTHICIHIYIYIYIHIYIYIYVRMFIHSGPDESHDLLHICNHNLYDQEGVP